MKNFVIISMTLLSFSILGSCQMMMMKPKTYIRIGILYDTHNADVASLIHDQVKRYAQVFGLTHTHLLHGVMFYQDIINNVAGLLINLNAEAIVEAELSFVVVAAKKVNCTNLSSVLRAIPFYYVTGSARSCDQKLTYNRMIYMFPSDSSLMATMFEALVPYNWDSAVVLFQENKEVHFTFQDIQSARELGIEITAFEAQGSVTSIKEKLIQAKRKGARTFVLVCSFTRLMEIMTVARQLELSTVNNHWFIPNVFLNPQVLHHFLKDGVRITFLHSALITPLSLQLMGKKPELELDAEKLFKEVVMVLVRLAIDANVKACGKLEDSCFNEKEVEGEMKKVNFCGPIVAELSDIALPTTSSHTTTHKMETTKPSKMDMHGDMAAMDDIAEPTKMMGHPTESSKMSGHETDAPSMHGSVEMGGHSTDESSVHGGDEMGGHDSIDLDHPEDGHAGIDFDFSCIMYNINATLIFPPGTVFSNKTDNMTTMDEMDHHRRKRQMDHMEMTEAPTMEGMDDGHGESAGGDSHEDTSNLFEVLSNFDPCPYKSNYIWNYEPHTCSGKLLGNTETLDSNAIFVIEHIHGHDPGSTVVKHKLLSVGARNGARKEIQTTYLKFEVAKVAMLERPYVFGVVWNPPWMFWDVDPETQLPVNGSFKGFLYDLVLNISSILKISFVINMDTVEEFGPTYEINDTGLEARMNYMFDYQKTIEGGRILESNVVELSAPIQTPKMYFITKRQEDGEQTSIWQFLLPFKVESWILLWSSYVLISLLMAYINKNNPNEFRRAARDLPMGAKASEHLGIMNSLWFNFASLVEQSAQLLPYSASLKVLTGFWWYFVMLVVASYTANMISFMTQANDDGITTIKELVGQKEVAYGILADNIMVRKFLPKATDPPYSTMWAMLKRDGGILNSTEDALDKVAKGSYIFVASYKTAVKAILDDCGNDMVGNGVYDYRFGLPVPSGWHYLPLLNDKLTTLGDKGILADLEQKWFRDIEHDCESSESRETIQGQLELKAFIGMYVFLILGTSIGILVCLYETGYIKYGGILGMSGKAKKYEFRKDHREHVRPQKLMEEEFKNWEGGWDVLKHQPFIDVDRQLKEPIGVDKKEQKLNSDTTMLVWKPHKKTGKLVACCAGCGIPTQAEEPKLKKTE